jgi:hypothetical protein
MEGTTKQLDLAKPVTREEYEHSIKRMIEFMEHELTDRHDWCDARWRYFGNVIPEFTAGATDNVDFGKVPADANYNERLDVTRRKLLWYARQGADTITLSEANEIFVRGGLPEYGVDTKTGRRIRIGMPYLDVNIAADSIEDAKQYARDHWLKLLVSLLDGKPVEDSKYVPGSAVFDASYGGASVESAYQTNRVREEDTTYPVDVAPRRTSYPTI